MKLIKLQDKFILVSDEKLKDGDWFYNTFSDNQPLIQQRKGDWTTCFNQQKIIAGIPELPSIDFSLLKEEDCKEIGWVDVEELADSSVNKVLLEEGRYWNDQDAREPVYYGIIEGFKTAQSLNDKMFSLEDMREAIAEAWNSCEDNEDGETFTQCFNRIIQSLQKTEWDVEVDKEDVFTKNEENYVHHTGAKGNYSTHNKQPKITNNSIKVIRIL